jgi:hypothetical protein
MNNKIARMKMFNSTAKKLFKRCFALVVFACVSNFSFSQLIDENFEVAEWLTAPAAAGNSGTTSGKVVITATSASNVVTYFTVQNSTQTTKSTNTVPNSGTWWYSKAQSSSDTKMNKVRTTTHSFQLSSSGYIITPVTKTAFVSVTFWAALQAPIIVGLNPNTGAAQPTYSSGASSLPPGFINSQTFASAGNSSMTSYSYTGTISGPARIGFFNTSSSSVYIDDITVIAPSGTPPSITTNTVTPGYTTAVVNGTVTPGTMPLAYSGVIWGSTNVGLDTSKTTKTVITPASTTTFNTTPTGLTPGSCYYYRAYVVDLLGNVYYGAILGPICENPPAIPALTTVAPFNVLPYKASSGGNNIDSGGLTITQKGVVWSTSPNPTTALTTKTNDGKFGTSFTSLMRILQPSTLYHVRAYATNSLGTGYGADLTFTTPVAAPALVADPINLNFGNVTFGSSSPISSYTLTGYNLTPANGTITVTAPAGYTVSTSTTGTFNSSLNIPYTGGGLVTTTIYVKFSTANYGTFSGTITNSGGGASAANSDNVTVTGTIIQDPTVTTNVGLDFWTGFGYQENMDQSSTNSSRTRLSIYISVPSGSQNASVNVEMPGIPGFEAWKQNLVITPGTITEVTDFPSGGTSSPNYNPSGLPDARLYYTGLSGRGIHVYSNNGVPVSVWMHTYANNNSAAGSMLFPTNTWNSSYTVQAYGGNSNNDNPNSFFFIVANEDNTPIWFKPSQDVLDSITGSSGTIFTDGHTVSQVKYPKNVEYGPFILNKGQVFNAMGFIQGNGSGIGASNAFGLDLSGSTVRTTCDKKIAVFGGNGRCLVNAPGCTASSGSDNMIQQMLPSAAWGTKYLTAPTKTMEYNLFRINVRDPLTVVKVNNTTITGLINNLYYEIQGSEPFKIESDKPINVTQFIVAGGCASANGSKGNGDPEMIILSPVKQAINKTTVYSSTIKTGASYNGHYINVIIKQGGISSFRLDGAAVADTGIDQSTATSTTCYDAGGTIPITNAFVQHPYDPTYYYAKFKVAPGTSHTLISDSSFNAIAYGMGDGESYGYNAGTVLKDLNTFLGVQNPYANSTATIAACKDNPFFFTVTLPFNASSLVWDFGGNPNLSPNTIITQNPATPISSFVQDGTTLYTFKINSPYTFSALGTYNVNITECHR